MTDDQYTKEVAIELASLFTKNINQFIQDGSSIIEAHIQNEYAPATAALSIFEDIQEQIK